MSKKSPYDIIKSRHVTEKTQMLEKLKDNTSNPCIKKFEQPKYVFIVDKKANKQEIAEAIEEIYAEKQVRVTKVNTINVRQKERRVRGRTGLKAGFKKAVITLKSGNSIE